MNKVIDHTSEQDEWILCHNDKDIYQLFEVQKGNFTSTGQPYLDVFTTEKDAMEKFGSEIDAYNKTIEGDDYAVEEGQVEESNIE